MDNDEKHKITMIIAYTAIIFIWICIFITVFT